MTCKDVQLSKFALKAILPFVVAFAAGIALNQLISSLTHQTQRTPCSRAQTLSVLHVPEVNFSEDTMHSTELVASLRLSAVFAADGQVRDVRIVPMLPWGVPDAVGATGKYSDTTGTLRNGRLVKDPPYGLVETAIEQVRNGWFLARENNGQPVSERVTINVDVMYNEQSRSRACEFIHFTVMNDRGVIWRGNTWAHRNARCNWGW